MTIARGEDGRSQMSASGLEASEVDPRMAERVRELLFGSPVARALGVVMQRLVPDRAVAFLPFRPENVTISDVVHGGVVAALVDITGVAAALSATDYESSRGSATSALSINYLAAAKSADLTATGVVLRRGRRQAVVEVAVESAKDPIAKDPIAKDPIAKDLVAKALMTVVLF